MLETKLFYFIYFIFNLELKENKKNLKKKKKTFREAKIDEETIKKWIFFFLNSVLPSILSVDIGAILNQALCNFNPTMERRHMERRAVVVVPSMHQCLIFLQKLPDNSSVVLVRMLENRRGSAHSHFLLLLQWRRHWRGASATAAFAASAVSAGSSFPFPWNQNKTNP